MREITFEMRGKYGCYECIDKVRVRMKEKNRLVCPYDECPFKELERFKNYQGYCKAYRKGFKQFIKMVGSQSLK